MEDNIVQEWFIRPEGEAFEIDIYGTYTNLFSLKCHYYGKFTNGPEKAYIEGETCFVDMVDRDKFNDDLILNSVANSLGYEMEDELRYYYKVPLKSLNIGLKPLVTERDYRNFLGYVDRHKIMYVYIEKVEEEEETDSGSDSDTSSDSENDLEDEEHVVQEVEVNMNHFSFEVEDVSDHRIIPANVSEKSIDSVPQKVKVTEDNIEVLEFDELESDLEDVHENARSLGLRKLKKKHSSSKFFIGREFANRDLAKELIRAHAVESRRNLHFLRNDPRRIRVICKGVNPSQNERSDIVQGPKVDTNDRGKTVQMDAEEDKSTCPWVLYLSKNEKGLWIIKTFNDEHHCLKSRKIKHCTSTFLSKHITDLIIMNPNMPIRAVQEQMQKKFHVSVSKDKAYRAKAKATCSLRGDVQVQYALLIDYLYELKRCNPDTTCKIDVYAEEDHESPTRMFRRVYVCLGALKRGFKEGGRELLGLDGAFMRGHYPGQMLTAVGVDANNGIYPVAHGIVESENQHSWTWFLKCLGDDFDLYSNSNFTFITDRQKGLLPALEKLFPHAEHRYYVRHIYENMNLIYRGSEYKEMLWKCASATTTVLFEKHMQELKDFNRKAREWLQKIPAEHWSRAFFSGRAHCDLLINNVCEVFNRQLLEARDSPIITALEHVREYLMKRIVIVQKVIEKSDGPLTPAVAKVFEIIKENASGCIVEWNGGDLYQVKGFLQEQYVVNLNQRTCSCRKWEISGIPCKHAIAAIHDMADNGNDVGIPEDWVHDSYKLSTWKAVYSHKVNPVNGRELWAKFECPTTLLPPKIHPQIGRPPKKRKKSKGEIVMVKGNKLTRKGKAVTCSLCKATGHNKRGCKAGGNGTQTTQTGQSNHAGRKRQASEYGTQASQSQGTTNQAGLGTQASQASAGSVKRRTKMSACSLTPEK